MLDVLEKPGNLLIHPRLFTFQNEPRSVLLSILPLLERIAIELNLIDDLSRIDAVAAVVRFPLSYMDEDERHSEVIPISSVASVVEPDEPP